MINSLSATLFVTKLGTVIPPNDIIAKSNSTHSILLFDNRKTLSPFFFIFKKKKRYFFYSFCDSIKVHESQIFFFIKFLYGFLAKW